MTLNCKDQLCFWYQKQDKEYQDWIQKIRFCISTYTNIATWHLTTNAHPHYLSWPQTSEMSSKSDIIVMAVVVTFVGLAYMGLYAFYFGRFIGLWWLEAITSPAVVVNQSHHLHQMDPYPEVYELSTLCHSRSPLQFLRPTSFPVTNMGHRAPPAQSSCQSMYLPWHLLLPWMD